MTENWLKCVVITCIRRRLGRVLMWKGVRPLILIYISARPRNMLKVNLRSLVECNVPIQWHVEHLQPAVFILKVLDTLALPRTVFLTEKAVPNEPLAQHDNPEFIHIRSEATPQLHQVLFERGEIKPKVPYEGAAPRLVVSVPQWLHPQAVGPRPKNKKIHKPIHGLLPRRPLRPMNRPYVITNPEDHKAGQVKKAC